MKIKAQIKKKNGNENLKKREVRSHNKLFAENKVRFTRAEQLRCHTSLYINKFILSEHYKQSAVGIAVTLCKDEHSYGNCDDRFTRYGWYTGSQARRSTVYSQLHFERHRREREIVFALETLGEVAVAALLELEALQ